MAVEDDEKYKKWDVANSKAEKRRQFYAAVKGKYPDNHPLVKKQKEELEKAEAELQKILNEL